MIYFIVAFLVFYIGMVVGFYLLAKWLFGPWEDTSSPDSDRNVNDK